MFRDHGHVFVLRVVFEVRIETIRPARVHHEEQPRQLIINERDRLRQPEKLDLRLSPTGPGEQLLDDKQVEHLVVLLRAGRSNPLVYAPGHICSAWTWVIAMKA